MRPRVRLRDHQHQGIHVCIVRQGGFAERCGSIWKECGPGSIRISPADAIHDLQSDGQGAHVAILVLPREITVGLAHPLRHSVYAQDMPAPWNLDRLDGTRGTEESFDLECLALELVARVASTSPRSSPPEWLLDLRRELDGEALKSRSLALLAARHGRHRAHVARSFRTWFGRSIRDHLRARLLAEAARQLRTTPIPIAALAHDLGFTDQAHLTRAFRSRYGCPPGRFRAACRAGATSVQDLRATPRQDS